MKTYILLLFDSDRQVMVVRALGAESQTSAVAEAHAIAGGDDKVNSYELWNGGRKSAAFAVGRRGGTSAAQSRQI